MKLKLLLAVALGSPVLALATAPEKFDLSCESVAGGIFIKFPKLFEKARITQRDYGMNETELTAVEFERLRCPGCYSFRGQLFGIQTRGTVANYNLTYEVLNSDSQSWEPFLSAVKCTLGP